MTDQKSYRKAVGRRLKLARVERGLTQLQAADKLSENLGAETPIEPSRIGNYEQGLRLPDPLTLVELCKIYNTSPGWIYEFDDAPRSSDEVDLLNRYRRTDDRGRSAIRGVAESQPEYQEETHPEI